MRTRIKYLRNRWLVCVAVLSFSFLGIAAPMRPDVQQLYDIYSSDVGGNDEAFAKAKQELSTRPDIKQDFWDALQRDYFQAKQDPAGKPSSEALSVLVLRKDLTPAEQKVITDELEHLINEIRGGLFIDTALILLANYPSPEHEELALRFLKRTKNQDYTLLSAYQTLSVIGGRRSLEAMKQVAARLKVESPDYWILTEVDKSIANLETKLSKESAVKKRSASETKTFTQAQRNSEK